MVMSHQELSADLVPGYTNLLSHTGFSVCPNRQVRCSFNLPFMVLLAVAQHLTHANSQLGELAELSYRDSVSGIPLGCDSAALLACKVSSAAFPHVSSPCFRSLPCW